MSIWTLKVDMKIPKKELFCFHFYIKAFTMNLSKHILIRNCLQTLFDQLVTFLLLWDHLESSLKNRRNLTRWGIVDYHKSAYALSKHVSLQHFLKGFFVEVKCVVSVTMKKPVCHSFKKFCQNKVMVSNVLFVL